MTRPSFPRRSFLPRLGAGLAGALAAIGATPSKSQALELPQDFKPARHPEDDWLDAIPGKHRFFFDSTTATGAGEAITFASNFFAANKSGYGLNDSDLAVVICLRHWSTPFAWTDDIWKKYGVPIAERIQFKDPKSLEAPNVNVYLSKEYGMQLPNRGTTITSMAQRGVHFAVCDMATRAYAGVIAGKVGGKAGDIYEELKAHSVENVHYAAAGILALNRAQERGYTLAPQV